MHNHERPIGLFPTTLADLLPAGAVSRHRLVPLRDPREAEDLGALAALWLPDAGVDPGLPLYALGPAAWQGRQTAFAADRSHRLVAPLAVETLLGLTGAGPLPPSAATLRRRMLREFVRAGSVLVAGGGKVGRAVHALLRSARVRSRLLTDHPQALPGTAPWRSLRSLLPSAAAVIWASERPLGEALGSLPRPSPLVVVPALGDEDLAAVAAAAPGSAGIAVTLYRPREIQAVDRLVVLSDSPRRQASAMAQFLRHLQAPR